jgi:hypothetical protein
MTWKSNQLSGIHTDSVFNGPPNSPESELIFNFEKGILEKRIHLPWCDKYDVFEEELWILFILSLLETPNIDMAELKAHFETFAELVYNKHVVPTVSFWKTFFPQFS